MVCVYLSDNEGNGITLDAQYIYDYKDQMSASHMVVLATPEGNDRCYVIIGPDYLAGVNLSEHEEDLDNELIYDEEISVYKLLEDSLEEMYRISRRLRSTSDTKDFQIQSDSEKIIYATGSADYTAEEAEFISTQQEFCDRANNLLANSSLGCITLNKHLGTIGGGG